MHASMLSRFSHVWLCNKDIQIITSLWVSCGSFIQSVSDFGSFGFPSFSVLILLISFFIFIIFYFCLSLVQLLSRVLLFATSWTTARQTTLPIINSWSPPKPCPLNQWCHPTISSSVVPFSSCPQPFPESGSFQMSHLFDTHQSIKGGQSIGVSASTSVLPMNTQDWSPLGWTGWISCSPRDSQESSPAPQFKSINSLALSFLHSPTLLSIHDHWKNYSLD